MSDIKKFEKLKLQFSVKLTQDELNVHNSLLKLLQDQDEKIESHKDYVVALQKIAQDHINNDEVAENKKLRAEVDKLVAKVAELNIQLEQESQSANALRTNFNTQETTIQDLTEQLEVAQSQEDQPTGLVLDEKAQAEYDSYKTAALANIPEADDSVIVYELVTGLRSATDTLKKEGYRMEVNEKPLGKF